MSTMRRAMASLAVLLCALTVTTACGSDSDGGSGGSTDPKVIKVTISGDSVTPNGERVDVAVGQEIQLEVTADEAGEIHVHSSPEQELEYEAGTHTVTIQGIDKPGTVDVESHALEKVIVQLEVS
jgi:ABC-type glycerol-3-phosphate transport system substrate-binding protein